MKVFTTSDQHFMHFNIIKYAKRPFELSDSGVSDCISTIVNKHNQIVSDEDVVINVGDLSHGRLQSEDILRYIYSNMKGRQFLVKGNHDKFNDSFYNEIFEGVFSPFLKIENTLICHYPLYESKWTSPKEQVLINEMPKDVHTIIHGHIHNKDPLLWEPDGFNRVNACVDFEPNNFYPVELNIPEVRDYFKKL